MEQILAIVLNLLLVVAAIFIHYEVLDRMSRLIPRLPFKPRARVIVGFSGALLAHTLEVLLFAVGYWLFSSLNLGRLTGSLESSFADYIYFSYVTFTTVGYGDIAPEGHIRWLSGIESLTGFMLVTWTASYLYLEMSQNWRHD